MAPIALVITSELMTLALALAQIGKRVDALSAAVADLQAKQAGPALKGE